MSPICIHAKVCTHCVHIIILCYVSCLHTMLKGFWYFNDDYYYYYQIYKPFSLE